MTISFGGKPVEPKRHHNVLTREQVRLKSAQLTQADRQANANASWNVDPIGQWQGRSQHELLSLFGDYTLSIEQGIHELAAHMWKLHRLTVKLADPALYDSPHRPDAETRKARMQFETSNQLFDLAVAEARCDRVWQAMDADTRSAWARRWGVTPETDRLIGQVFLWHVGMEEWPPNANTGTQWLRALPVYLHDELKAVGAYRIELKRNPERAPF